MQDSAVEYIRSTDFVTGHTFAETDQQEQSKSTSTLQYTYLMLYLERKHDKEPEEMTPLEDEVIGKVLNGDAVAANMP
eukprot:SAG31_NODE_845_length_11547_cov_8.098096_6_plen_78_part_00